MSEDRVPFEFGAPPALVGELRWLLDRFLELSLANGILYNWRHDYDQQVRAERGRAQAAVVRAIAALTPYTPPVIPAFDSLSDAFTALRDKPGSHAVRINNGMGITHVHIGEKRLVPSFATKIDTTVVWASDGAGAQPGDTVTIGEQDAAAPPAVKPSADGKTWELDHG